MSTPDNNSVSSSTERRKSRLVAGVILILIGLFALASTLMSNLFAGQFFLPLLGTCFLAWGLITRKTGLLIPGGILLGLGVGAVLIEGPFAEVADPARGGIFLLAFASGWVLISLLTFYTEQGTFVWWPLIPGGVLGLVGAALLAGGAAFRLLELLGQGWPVVLIALGLYMILRRKEMKE